MGNEPRSAATPRETYTEKIAERARLLKSLRAQRTRTSYLRLVAVAAILALIWFAVRGQSPAWVIAVPVAALIALVSWQSRIERDTGFTKRAIAFFERGLARLENRWQGTGESGDRFRDAHHPYTTDLDIFGRGSLFELLSTARTRGGEALLADWLKAPAPLDQLRARHEALEELRPLLDLREQLAVAGDSFRKDVNPGHLREWSGAPAQPFSNALRVVALALAILSAAMIVWWFGTQFVGIASRRGVILAGMLDGAFALYVRTRILAILYAVHEPSHDLDLLARILAILERQDFRSPALKALSAAIQVDGNPASRRIARLRRWMELLDSRDNVFVRIFGPPLLWGTQIGMGVENWRAANGPRVATWLDAVSEMEALVSLANYAWERPEDPLPSFAAGAVFDGEALGHPLLPDARCIRNSVPLAAPARLFVISGSNMSGKSTLLRATGINAVLALAGAPVRARRLTISHLALGASIRTMDSLEEGHSRFMAEILRLKQILELPAPAFFLLDELLHGTNSHDRAVGAEGLIRALLARGAIGLATTHDLSLARVADELAPAAVNVHFEDRLEDGRLVFDYTMRPGVVTRSNALDLMRAVGLNV